VLRSVSRNVEANGSGAEHDGQAVERFEEFEFTFVVDEQVLARFFADPGEYLVGSVKPADVLIDIDGIAPEHARLTLGETVSVTTVVPDAAVLVDGEDITARTELRPAQVITFGNGVGELRFERHTHATLVAPQLVPAEIELPIAEPAELPETEAAELRVELPPPNSPLEGSTSEVPDTDLQTEVDRLRAEVERLAKERSTAESAAALKAEIQGKSTGLLTTANEVLLRKFKEATEQSKEATNLRKELKQREVALVEAWTRRQAADERMMDLETRLARAEVGRPGAQSSSTKKSPSIAWAAAAVLLLAIAVLARQLKTVTARAEAADAVVALVKATAPQLHQQALESLQSGKLDEARARITYALALEPEVASYHLTAGRIHQSLLRLPEAQGAFERALALGGPKKELETNIALCRSILRTRQGTRAVENLYALHRLMMEQQRLPEALLMAQRLETDRVLLQKTWAAVLDAGRVLGDLTVNDDGSFHLRLHPNSPGSLAVLKGMPLQSLIAARTNIEDLSPLRGMPLRRVDLSQTTVHDIEVLRGMPLEELDLSNTAIKSLGAVVGMPLKKLKLEYTVISDIAVLGGMPLEELSLLSTRVSNIAALAQSPLRVLNLAHTSVRDLTPLKHLPIEQLNLERSAVIDLTPLAGGQLTSLILSETRVQDLAPLRGAPLQQLWLAGCTEIATLEPLRGCLDLERLILSHKGPSPTPLRDLPRLRFLAYDNLGPSAGEQTAQQFWSGEQRAVPTGSNAGKAAAINARPRSNSRPYSQ
jgi:tetratricopeptide (TPR) repeat protein